MEKVESKAEEIGDKVGEIVDKELTKLEEKVEDLLNTINKKVEESEVVKQVEAVIDKWDDNPMVKEVSESVIEQVDGRVVSCFCFGWNLSLRINRKKSPSSQTKPLQSVPPSSERRLSKLSRNSEIKG